MNQEPSDDDWFDALRGGADKKGDAGARKEALVVRKALQQRAERLDRAVPEAGTALYQKLLFRLRRERLAPFRPRMVKLPALALAASVVLGIAIMVQVVGPFGEHEEQIRLRGPDQGTLIATKDPERRAQELIHGLRSQGVEAKIDRSQPERITLVIDPTPSAMNYLKGQRIEAEPFNGEVRLTLAKKTR